MTQVRSIATASPLHAIRQEDALHIAKLRNQPKASQEHWMKTIYSKSGVEQRHSVLLEQPASDCLAPEQRQSFYQDKQSSKDSGPSTAARMEQYTKHGLALACQASQTAMEASAFTPSTFTHLITVSCTGFAAPGIDIGLIEHLKLPADIARAHIGFMGCHGGMNALRIADHIVRANKQARVLVCATELCSLHYQYDFQPDQIIANALFADGSAAIVVTHDEQDTKPISKTHDSVRFIASGSYVFPNTLEAMTWKIGDHGFVMTLSPHVPELIERELAPWIDRWLQSQELTRADIEHWAIHPGGPKILDSVVASLDLRSEAAEPSRNILRRFGNMSSPTSFFVLKEMMDQGHRGKCVMLGFGPGLAVETALLEI